VALLLSSSHSIFERRSQKRFEIWEDCNRWNQPTSQPRLKDAAFSGGE
jgi:hypothetical protein